MKGEEEILTNKDNIKIHHPPPFIAPMQTQGIDSLKERMKGVWKVSQTCR